MHTIHERMLLKFPSLSKETNSFPLGTISFEFVMLSKVQVNLLFFWCGFLRLRNDEKVLRRFYFRSLSFQIINDFPSDVSFKCLQEIFVRLKDILFHFVSYWLFFSYICLSPHHNQDILYSLYQNHFPIHNLISANERKTIPSFESIIWVAVNKNLLVLDGHEYWSVCLL